jgi:hypothetical protein
VKLLDVFPQDTYPPIRYPIAMTAGAGADASRFVEFVTGKRAAVIFQNYGFALIAMAGQAATAADTDPCTRFTWDVSHERAVMKQTPQAVAAAVKASAYVPQIEPERLYAVKLAGQSTVTFVAKPGKTLNDGAHAGLVRFRVEKAGRYRVSITSGHWIDIVDGTQLVSSRDFQAGN